LEAKRFGQSGTQALEYLRARVGERGELNIVTRRGGTDSLFHDFLFCAVSLARVAAASPSDIALAFPTVVVMKRPMDWISLFQGWIHWWGGRQMLTAEQTRALLAKHGFRSGKAFARSGFAD